MIHIFNCAKEICSLPGRLCTECSKLCDYINCNWCEDICMAMSNCCRGFLEKPLSSYVVITCLISVVEIALCTSSLSAPALEGCNGKLSTVHVGARSWLLIQIGFAAINLLFAPYFQSKVWQHLCEQVASGAALGGKIGPDVVQRSFKDVFLHDFGVLFYFIALVASFLWSWKGSDWQYVAFCNPDGMVYNAALLGMCLFWVAFLYSITWYWCACCARSVDPAAVRSDIETGHVVPSGPTDAPTQASQALYYGQGGPPSNNMDPQYRPVRR